MTEEAKKAYVEKYRASLPVGSRRSYSVYAEQFEYWLEDRPHDDRAVRDYIEHIKSSKRHFADGTVRKIWGILRRYYVVNDWKWPFRRGDAPIIREMEQGGFALAVEDIAAMVDVVLDKAPPLGEKDTGPEHHAFLCLSTVWGLRISEMVQLTRQPPDSPPFVDLENRLLFVETRKHGRQRYHAIPDYIVPHLAVFDFSTRLSLSRISDIFGELKIMIGFTGPKAYGMGWHSIRRAAIAAAWDAAVPENIIDSFYRHKAATMSRRYGSTRIVGRAIDLGDVGGSDTKKDERVYSSHPFMKFWR